MLFSVRKPQRSFLSGALEWILKMSQFELHMLSDLAHPIVCDIADCIAVNENGIVVLDRRN